MPADCFDYYVGLGADRSYQAVADHFGVSKTAVVNKATKENWQERVDRLEANAREAADQKLGESLEQMAVRHLRSYKAVQAKALETLKNMSLDNAMDAVRALDLAVKGERLTRGEPSDRTALSVEDAIRREFDRWTVIEDENECVDDGEAQES